MPTSNTSRIVVLTLNITPANKLNLLTKCSLMPILEGRCAEESSNATTTVDVQFGSKQAYNATKMEAWVKTAMQARVQA